MTVTTAVAGRQRELEEQRQAFVRATVVRTQHPTSARAGDVAVIDALGAMTGFVGGTCVEASVREFSLNVLETGEPVLLQVRPGDVGRTELEGAVEVHNPCLSGGSIDVFLEPVLPAAHVVVVGETPVAQALARLGADVGFEMELVDGESWQPGESDAALIVASHGRGEEPALERALLAGVPYIGLVASGKRGPAVVASLNVPDELRARVHTPAGLRLGGSAPAEVALGVLAQLVQVRATSADAGADAAAGVGADDFGVGANGSATGADGSGVGADGSGGAAGDHASHAGHAHAHAPRTAIDPVCKMTVVTADPTPYAEVDGATVWFCSDGCRSAFLADPSAYAAA